MSSLRSTIRDVGICDLFRACRNIELIDRSIEKGKCGDWLVKWNLMSRLVHASEREVAILSRLTILNSMYHQGCIFGSTEFGCICMLCLQTDGLSSKPVADIVSISVDERDADGAVQDHLQIIDEVGVDKVAGLLESVVDLIVRVLSVIGVDANCFLR